jgi:L-fucose isomerase-like protein
MPSLKEIQNYVAAKSIPPVALLKMAKFGVAVDRWMKQTRLNATAIQCWTAMEEFFGVVPCTLMSMMSNMLMSSACEVDIMGTVAMVAMAQASGRPSALVDWNNNYGEDPDKGVVFHCSNLPKDVFVEKGEGKPVMDYQEIIAGTVGKENTYGTIVGRVKASPFTYLRVSTDDAAGKIRAYIGEGELTDDPAGHVRRLRRGADSEFPKAAALHLRKRLRTSRRHQPDPHFRRRAGSPGQLSRLGPASPARKSPRPGRSPSTPTAPAQGSIPPCGVFSSKTLTSPPTAACMPNC